jgi:integrase
MNILFWVYKSKSNQKGNAPLIMRITIDKERAEIYTKIEIPASSWDHQRQKVKGSSELARQYNKSIQTFKTSAWNYYDEAMQNHKPIHAGGIKDNILLGDISRHTLLEAFDYLISNMTARIGNDITPNTVKKYHTCKRKIKEFLKMELQKDDIYLFELSGKFIFKMDAFLRTHQHLKHNAVVKNMQQLKRVIKVAIQNEWLNQDPFSGYSTAPKETDRGFLTEEELRSLEALELPSERLEKVRDIFIFCCYTGLAYADVSKLSKSHLIKGVDNNTWIILSRTKSKTQATIPVLPKALTIMEKYVSIYQGDPRGLLLPVISNQNLNKYIKEVGVSNLKL